MSKRVGMEFRLPLIRFRLFSVVTAGMMNTASFVSDAFVLRFGLPIDDEPIVAERFGQRILRADPKLPERFKNRRAL